MRLWQGQPPKWVALITQFVCFMIDLKVYATIKFNHWLYQFLVAWFKFYIWLTTTSTDRRILYAVYNRTEYDITPHVRYFYKTHPVDQHTCWRLEKFLEETGSNLDYPIEIVQIKKNCAVKSLIHLKEERELISMTDLDFGSIELDTLKGKTIPLVWCQAT